MLTAPKCARDLSELIDEAIFETRELVRWVEDEMDDHVSDLLPVFEAIERGLCDLNKRLREGAAAGQTGATGEDLPFMVPARAYRRFIPYYSMLVAINRAYGEGVGSGQQPL